MSRVNLNQQERTKFAEWLMQEIEDDKLLIIQMEKIPNTKPLVDQRKIEIKASFILLDKLMSIEDVTIGD